MHLVYIGQRGDKLGDIPTRDASIDETYVIRAGKLRRYHGQSLLKQLLDLPTLTKNVRDIFRVLIGTFESWRLLGKLRPDLIFIKGGFVGVPVGIAASRRHVPFITHDSDSVPGLANRLIARWATIHAVALPKTVYPYPLDKTVTVGVPVQEQFKKVDEKLEQSYRKDLGIQEYKKVIFITGGGQGAKKLNMMVMDIVPELLRHYDDLVIVHVAGRKHDQSISEHYSKTLSKPYLSRVMVKGYVEDLYKYSGAADVVIARAGATNIAEFAVQGKACIIVPNPLLTSGHQLKNAEILTNSGAVKLVTESKNSARDLLSATTYLLNNPKERQMLEQKICTFANPDSAKHLAELIISSVQK